MVSNELCFSESGNGKGNKKHHRGLGIFHFEWIQCAMILDFDLATKKKMEFDESSPILFFLF